MSEKYWFIGCKRLWQWRILPLLFTFHFSLLISLAQDTYNQIDEYGNVSRRSDNFNKHNNDTTRNKEIPKGFYTWTVDRTFGDISLTEPDTVPHLFMNTTFNSGMYGEYNHTGSNYTARQSRIFFNRPATDIYFFSQPYSFVEKRPERFLFMNTLSPYTTILYDNCGDKTSGEDHIDAKFAINASKQLNFGFDLEYAYARGYFQNQNQSHFNATLFSSYTGDKYNMHLLFTNSHQKVNENGGIENDNYIVHPELYTESYNENEIPTVLSQTWNRDDHQHLFFTHRYNIGFYRKVKMTDEEIKARQFAEAAKKDKEKREAQEKDGDNDTSLRQEPEKRPTGRPDNARIVGAEPKAKLDSLAKQTIDTTRIKIEDQATLDSLTRAQAIQDSIDATMKDEFVPVTSFFHTLEWNNYRHIYQQYRSPDGYYKHRYYDKGILFGNDSIYDQTKHQMLRNVFGIGLLEGFNKYVKAGLKAFISYEHRGYEMPDTLSGITNIQRWNENDITIGGLLSKTQGHTLHFNLGAEAWVAGDNVGQLHLDFSTDLNFPLFGDTVQLAAKAYFHRDNPGFFQTKYHAKHVWWDNNDLSAETRTRIEGIFSYSKTNTTLRVGIEEMQHYTYFGMSYDNIDDKRTNLTASVLQESGNINIMMAQLHQNFRLGPLNWENVITYQNTSNKEVLPLPTWNIFSNLYLKFKVAKVLGVELGADAIWFSKYYAPDFCPAINQFAIQQNTDSRVELGGYPFVDVYANMVLKKVRFFVMMSHVNAGSGSRMQFLTPHYPTNGSIIHFGVSWVFYN